MLCASCGIYLGDTSALCTCCLSGKLSQFWGAEGKNAALRSMLVLVFENVGLRRYFLVHPDEHIRVKPKGMKAGVLRRRLNRLTSSAFKPSSLGGAWVAQSVERPTSAWVMISQFVSLSPALDSVLTAQSLEPASNSVSPSLSASPLLMLCLSVKNKHLKKMFFFKVRRSTREQRKWYNPDGKGPWSMYEAVEMHRTQLMWGILQGKIWKAWGWLDVLDKAGNSKIALKC